MEIVPNGNGQDSGVDSDEEHLLQVNHHQHHHQVVGKLRNKVIRKNNESTLIWLLRSRRPQRQQSPRI